jgi:hypothetical protein
MEVGDEVKRGRVRREETSSEADRSRSEDLSDEQSEAGFDLPAGVVSSGIHTDHIVFIRFPRQRRQCP